MADLRQQLEVAMKELAVKRQAIAEKAAADDIKAAIAVTKPAPKETKPE
jgi:hypothetical protein